MASIGSICLDVFLMGVDFAADGRAGDGYGFEAVVANRLARRGVPVRGEGRARIIGPQSLSGLRHQIDAQGDTGDGFIIGEWKAHRGAIPKNELLRFHAVTEDYWLQRPSAPDRPVFRLFGGTGSVTHAARRFAARWGITIITPETWPALALADPHLAWPDGDGPSSLDRRALAWLTRPMQSVYDQLPDGRIALPTPVDDATVDARLALHDRWSEQAWRWWFDSDPARLDAMTGDGQRFDAA